MRFERLHLQAYGPFTDQVLDLSGGPPGGLHVIYGPNEAGKSTSLRAVTAFLFGFPHKTTDAHVHPQNRLSVGAIVSGRGQTYELCRLKRRKDDLIDLSGTPVTDNPLPGLLTHLDERSFISRFGLDQAELERGAEALLGGSEQGLFAAGTAGAQARRVLEDLEKGVSELYLARGKVPRLNKALVSYEEAAREARRGERPPEKYIEQKRAHEEAIAAVASLKKQRNQVRADLRRLNRLRSVMAELRDWESARVRRAQLGQEPRLTEDATEVRIAAERQLQQSEIEGRRIAQEIANFEEELAALPPESALVSVDEEQLALSTRVGTALSARKDLPKRQASLLEQVRLLGQLLGDLGIHPPAGKELEAAREKLVSARTVAVVRRLLADHGAVTTEVKQTQRTVRRLEAEVARLELQEGEQGASPELLDELDVVIADAQAEQSLPTRLEEAESRSRALGGSIDQIRAELGMGNGSAHDGTAQPDGPSDELPSRRQARQMAQVFAQAEAALSELDKESAVLKEQKADLQARFARETRDGVPSDEKLVQVRSRRDAHLVAIEQAVSAGNPMRSRDLPELNELIQKSDTIADRLRHEADRVARVAALEREIAKVERQMSRATEDRHTAEERRRTIIDRYESFLQKMGISPFGSPGDAEEVVESLRALRAKELELRVERQTSERDRSRLQRLTGRLKQHLPEVSGDADLAGLLAAARRKSQGTLEVVTRQKQRDEALGRARSQVDEAAELFRAAESELNAWKKQWEEALRPLGLSGDATVALAEETLGTFEKIARILDVATNLEGRILGMERDTEALAHDVREVLRRHLPQLLEANPVDAAVELQEAIRVARRVSEERGRYKRLVGQRREALAKVQVQKNAAEVRLQQLVRQAGVKSMLDLPAAEERKAEIKRLERKLEDLERTILDAAEGASIAQLQSEAEQWKGRGQLIERIDELDAQSQELEDELRQAESDEQGKKLGLLTYRSLEVVEARQRASARASEAREAVHEYLVLRAAHTLLSSQIERYATRFAGPIAGRASDMFQRMTLGRYSALRVGLGERTLRCVRDGQELEVAELSRGTRAQLYFALRLASLEAYFEQHEAIPLVFDDLFVDFDDDRTTATFEILAEVARRVQVLYFTHLARDVEAAHDAVPVGLLYEHRLGVG